MKSITRIKNKETKLAWTIYAVIVLLSVSMLSSCSTNKGYNYKKHYRTQKVKKKVTQFFDIDNCRKNNHSYN